MLLLWFSRTWANKAALVGWILWVSLPWARIGFTSDYWQQRSLEVQEDGFFSFEVYGQLARSSLSCVSSTSNLSQTFCQNHVSLTPRSSRSLRKLFLAIFLCNFWFLPPAPLLMNSAHLPTPGFFQGSEITALQRVLICKNVKPTCHICQRHWNSPFYSSMEIIVRTAQKVKPEFSRLISTHLLFKTKQNQKKKNPTDHNNPKKQLPATVICLSLAWCFSF